MSIQVFYKLLHVLLLLSPLIMSSYSQGDLKILCSKLPYPETCEYYLGKTSNSMKNPNSSPNDVKQDVLKQILKAVAGQVNREGTHINTLGTKCRNNLEKTAWHDCQELYKYTIDKLNKTADPNSQCSQEDMQTWLSASLTNLQTCEDGFVELGVTDYIMTLILSKNVTNMISNALALNNVPFNAPSYQDGFPTWIKPGDQQLLEAPVQPPSSWWPSIAEPPTFMAPAHAPSAPPPGAAEAPMPFIKPDVVVAKDGSGDFKTLSEAISAASSRAGNGRFVIYMKEGVYNENVEIREDNIMLVGDGIGKTIITGSKSVGGGTTTFRSATVAVVGDNFMARGITFRNTAGPQNHQAVALRSGSDFSVFYRCSFEAYQDTLYVHSERQFYKECDIYGTVDFIFGNAAVVLQNCNIKPRNPPNRTNTLTAQSRMDPNENTGIIIHNCIVTPSDELKPVQSNVKTFLGRPWRQYSRVVYMKTFLDSFIHPEGWMEWDGNFALNTLFYAEFANTGLGSSTANRVTWKGYHSLTSPRQVSEFTVANFISGNSWLPAAGVPFTPGL